MEQCSRQLEGNLSLMLCLDLGNYTHGCLAYCQKKWSLVELLSNAIGFWMDLLTFHYALSVEDIFHQHSSRDWRKDTLDFAQHRAKQKTHCTISICLSHRLEHSKMILSTSKRNSKSHMRLGLDDMEHILHSVLLKSIMLHENAIC